jgi:hypothetical protein
MKFNENLTNGSCVVTCGDIEERMDRQKNIIKLVVFFTVFFLKMQGNKMSIHGIYRISPLSGAGIKDRLSV